MWIFTGVGRFSKIQKSNLHFLIIRARLASDLDQLRKEYLPELSNTVISEGTCYPYYSTINYKDFVWGIARMRKDIQYSTHRNEGDDKRVVKNRYMRKTKAQFENLKCSQDVKVAIDRLLEGKSVVCPFFAYKGKMPRLTFFRVEESKKEWKDKNGKTEEEKVQDGIGERVS